jgi:hypothetical protein
VPAAPSADAACDAAAGGPPPAPGGPPAAPGAPAAGTPVAPTQLPPPPMQIPPNCRPQLVVMQSAAPEEVVSEERVWEEVGGRHQQWLEKEVKSTSPQRKDIGLSLAFKRRTFGLYFRCLATDHFVANCQSSIRCLGCGHSGHRERDCKAHHAPG